MGIATITTITHTMDTAMIRTDETGTDETGTHRLPATSASLLVCRGCCCGTNKHPDVDHDAQVETLRVAVAEHPRTRLYTTDCLGPCERSNVVVVRSGRTKRWFGGLLGVHSTEALAEWASEGAVGDVPAELEPFEFTPEAHG